MPYLLPPQAFWECQIPTAGGLEAEEEAGVGLWLTLGFVGMAHRCRRSLQRMAKGHFRSSKLMIRLIVWVVVAAVEAVRMPALPLHYSASWHLLVISFSRGRNFFFFFFTFFGMKPIKNNDLHCFLIFSHGVSFFQGHIE
jgi:hypothetical protein